MACGEVSPTSAVGESLLFASPKRSNQEKGDPGIARQKAPCPALLAGLGPARPSEAKAQPRSGRARTSMCSNIRAFPPSPVALLGAMTGPVDQQPKQEQGNSKSRAAAAGEPLLFGSPVQRRRAGDQARRGACRRHARFCQYTDVLSKTPPDRRVPAALSRARTRGGLSLGYFSLATQREVTRRPPTERSEGGCEAPKPTKPCEESSSSERSQKYWIPASTGERRNPDRHPAGRRRDSGARRNDGISPQIAARHEASHRTANRRDRAACAHDTDPRRSG
jgi:hypothetical protein